MNNRPPIIVFEHSTLSVDDDRFTEKYFNALVKFNDLHKKKYFKVGHKKITFKSYVGVIQTGNLIIEILPKADSYSAEDNVVKWQNALLVMLKNAGYIRLNRTNTASLDVSRTDLMDIYLYAFLKEIEKLVHEGLIKKYRRTQGNRTTLNGRWLIEKQLHFNIIHKERFYTEYTTYDIDHQLNGILKAALEIIRKMSLTTSIKQEASRLLLWFDGVSAWHGKEEIFGKITYDRKTTPYRHAIELAKMLILNYCPEFSSGSQYTLALLFDMNLLFEKFIFRMLKNKEDDFAQYELSVTAQNSQTFWEDKTICPDILVSHKKQTGETASIIIDTKWKVVDEGSPSDSDLKQMFAYNMQFGADHALLLYPFIGQKNHGKKHYAKGRLHVDFTHACEMYFIDIFDPENNINPDFAHSLLSYLMT